MGDINILVEGLKEYGFNPTDKQIWQFDIYYKMLVEKNKVMNLTAIIEYDEVMVKHFLDSLAIVKVAEQNGDVNRMLNGSDSVSLLDLGTGAGFPGLPIKIMFPYMKVTLMDSLNKRIRFLNEVIETLQLENITAVHARAEEFARKPEYREQYDFVVSRAVAKMATLTEFCFPYVKVGGYFLPYKSASAQEEINEAENAIKTLGGKVDEIVQIELPQSDIVRMIPVVKKNSSTSSKYPRVGKKAETNPI
ncbi:MAG: 16S rRNA (guanine(527)-N(7))-methyltransferase RsmG [Lachnospiraceae bacterium]